jgi:hypothetical protein
MFLMAHLESCLGACLISVKFKPRKEICAAGLRFKIDMINTYLLSTKQSISLDVKDAPDLRNIIVHADPFRGNGSLNEVDVFKRLTVGYLRRLSNSLDIFLNMVCQNCGVERFVDTAHALEKIGSALGKCGPIEEI